MQRPLYDSQSTYRNDRCYVEARDVENRRIEQYNLYGGVAANHCEVRRPDLDHRNVFLNHGYGYADACTVDRDSALRNNASSVTNPRLKNQLFERIYHAVPDLRGGLPRPDVESRLLSGDVDDTRHCTGGADWGDRPFLPMQACVATAQLASHIVPDWTWGGEPTRDYVRREDSCRLLGARR